MRTAWIGVVILLVFGAVGCSEPEASEERPDPPVNVNEVRQIDLEQTITAVATLEANQRVRIRSKLEERIRTFEVEEGSFVEEGTLIARLDDATVQNRLQSVESSLEEARTERMDARRDLDRMERLYEEDLVPERDYEDAQVRLGNAQSQVNQLESERNQAREDLGETEIRAPFGGFIGERLVDRGQLLSSGEAIVNLMDVDPLQVSFSVSGRYSDRIEPGQRLRLTRDGSPELQGEITYVAPEIDPSTRSLALKGYLENPDRERTPGEFGRLELVTGVLEDRTVIPEEALIAVRDGHIVFVVDEENVAHRRDVEIGPRIGARVVVQSGLEPGERVIREGHQQVGDGTRVRVAESD